MRRRRGGADVEAGVCRYIFMEFKSGDDAARALATMHGHPFDAKHTFAINRFTDFERFLHMDEAYEEPALEEYQSKVRIFP